ncbi:uncharacterized protein LOC118435720 [Folsomia candida]|uniref:uncharacterized protein LOC118435720 n=1 Tax=Folsomia candida TaxID=158441 RepID=UPI001605257E|nr:uncharacterized protein LOC118435720 [Folsomia candida]
MSGTCCRGWYTLGQGTLTIGILNVVVGVFIIVWNSMGVNFAINYPDGFITGSFFHRHLALIITVDCITIFVMVVFFVMACFLIHGYRLRSHRWITPWLIWSYVTLGYCAFVILALFLVFVADGRVAEGFHFLAVYGCLLGVQTYFIFVVKRFVQELKGVELQLQLVCTRLSESSRVELASSKPSGVYSMSRLIEL